MDHDVGEGGEVAVTGSISIRADGIAEAVRVYVGRVWGRECDQSGLDVEDVASAVVAAMLEAEAHGGGHDASRGEHRCYVWHVSRSVVRHAQARASTARRHVGEATACDCRAEVHDLAASVAMRLEREAEARADVRLVALAALACAHGDGLELSERAIADRLDVPRPVAREGLALLRRVTREEVRHGA